MKYGCNYHKYKIMKGGIKMKRFLSLAMGVVLSAAMLLGSSDYAFAAENDPEMAVNASDLSEGELKTIIVDMEDVLSGDAVTLATSPQATKTLSKDYATSSGQTGVITSIGQIVDFSSVIPEGATIQSITIYCPTGTKVTQSKYTSINNYLVTDLDTGDTTTITFQTTNNPSSKSTSTALAGKPANVRFLVQIQGKILQQYTGMDGFTVFGGKMIVTYRE